VSLDDYNRAYREIRAEEERRDFSIHLVVLLLVNLLLVAINFMYSPGAIWFLYPLIGWGIGVTIHYLNAVYWIDDHLKKKEAEAGYRARGYR